MDTAHTAGFGAGQSCALWYLRDSGASFAFHDIVLPNPGGYKDFRDPTVFWHAPTERWVMTLSEEGKIGVYTSANLKQWTYASGFASAIVGRVMECSHLFKLHLYDANGEISADKWILLVGGNDTKLGFTVGAYYWVGISTGRVSRRMPRRDSGSTAVRISMPRSSGPIRPRLIRSPRRTRSHG